LGELEINFIFSPANLHTLTDTLATFALSQNVAICSPLLQPVNPQNGGFTYLQEKAIQRILKIVWFEH
jgi:hypothetical protein